MADEWNPKNAEILFVLPEEAYPLDGFYSVDGMIACIPLDALEAKIQYMIDMYDKGVFSPCKEHWVGLLNDLQQAAERQG